MHLVGLIIRIFFVDLMYQCLSLLTQNNISIEKNGLSNLDVHGVKTHPCQLLYRMFSDTEHSRPDLNFRQNRFQVFFHVQMLVRTSSVKKNVADFSDFLSGNFRQT